MALALSAQAQQQRSVLQRLFLALPDSSALNLTLAEREQMLAPAAKPIGENNCRIAVLDSANGYLRLACAVEGTWEMAYWQAKDSARIVGIATSECGPECDGELLFFQVTNDSLVPAPDMAPAVVLSDLINLKLLTADLQQDMRDAPPGILYRLPRKGTTIQVVLDELGAEDIPANARRKVGLIWQDGRFQKVVK